MTENEPRSVAFSLDRLAEWGDCRPRGVKQFLFPLIAALPRKWLGRRLALLLRKPIKQGRQLYYDRKIWGLRLRLCCRGNLSEQRWLSMEKFHDRVERVLLREAFKPGAVFLDLGANVGFYTFWALAHRAEGMRILAVEPSEGMLSTIRYNLSLNEAEGAVELFACALTDRASEVYLTEGRDNLGESCISGDQSGQSVRGLPLLDLVREAKLDKIDAIKIDIEGYEEAVMEAFFQEAPQHLWPKMIVGEIIGSGGNSFSTLLTAHGYRLSCQTKMNGIFVLA